MSYFFKLFWNLWTACFALSFKPNVLELAMANLIELMNKANVSDPSKLSKNLRSLTRKIREFIDYLKNRNDYDTVFTHLGDGMSVSKRK